MHEVAIMSSIIEAVLAELDGHEVERVEEVTLVVGELTFLGEEQLRFAFDVLSRGTILEGASLRMEKEELSVKCPACGYEGKADYVEDSAFHYSIPVLACPRCGGRVEVLKGKSCGVSSLRVVES